MMDSDNSMEEEDLLEAQEPTNQEKEIPNGTRNVILASINFLVLDFTTFAALIYQPTYNRNLGFFVLATVFLASCLGWLVSSTNLFRERLYLAPICGGLGVSVFLLSNIVVVPAVLVIASIFGGLGLSLLVTANNELVARWSSHATVDKHFKISNYLNVLKLIVGSVLVAILLLFDVSFKTIFIIFSVLTLLSVLLFIISPRPPSTEEYEVTSLTKAKSAIVQLKSRYFQLAFLLVIFTGLKVSFTIGILPHIISTAEAEPEIANVGFVIGMYGCGYFFMGVMLNGFKEKMEGKPVLIVAVIVIIISAVILVAVPGAPLALFIPVAAILGIAECVFYETYWTELLHGIDNRMTQYGTILAGQMMQDFITGIILIWAPALPDVVFICLLATSGIFGVILLYYRKSKYKEQQHPYM